MRRRGELAWQIPLLPPLCPPLPPHNSTLSHTHTHTPFLLAARSVRGRRGGAAGHRGVPRRRPQAARRAVRAAGGARAARCCSTRARLPSRMPHVGNVLRGHQARKLLPLGGGGRRAGRRGAVGRRAGGGGGSGEQHTRRGAYERRVRGCGRGRTAGGRLWQLSADGARRAAAPALRHTGGWQPTRGCG
eukprot:178458-Chlamydomonas_euryale.AAC.1